MIGVGHDGWAYRVLGVGLALRLTHHTRAHKGAGNGSRIHVHDLGLNHVFQALSGFGMKLK